MYLEIKQQVKDSILATYGTFTEFAKVHSDKGYTSVKISRILNPSTDCHLSSLMKICRLVNLEVQIVGIPKKVA